MDTFIQSHLHDYHTRTSPSISTAGSLLEESRLIAFAQGQRVSGVWASSLLVTTPFPHSNRSHGCLQSPVLSISSPLPLAFNSHEEAALVYPALCRHAEQRHVANGFTGLQRDRMFKKPLSGTDGGWGYAQCPRPSLCGVGVLSFLNLEMCHLLNHAKVFLIYNWCILWHLQNSVKIFVM